MPQRSVNSVKNLQGFQVIHGHSSSGLKTPTYLTWKGMRQRCSNPKTDSFKYYGGKGISVCERWSSFVNFLSDMGEKPEGMTIGRIDSSKNYEPSNCRWETRLQQNNNTSWNRFITHNGETMTLTQWDRKLGLVSGCMSRRIIKGWSVEKACSTPTLTKYRKKYGPGSDHRDNWPACSKFERRTA